MEYKVHCCNACPLPKLADLPPTEELTPTDIQDEFLFDEELVAFTVFLGAAEEEPIEETSGFLCPLHVDALSWLLQAEQPAAA